MSAPDAIRCYLAQDTILDIAKRVFVDTVQGDNPLHSALAALIASLNGRRLFIYSLPDASVVCVDGAARSVETLDEALARVQKTWRHTNTARIATRQRIIYQTQQSQFLSIPPPICVG